MKLNVSFVKLLFTYSELRQLISATGCVALRFSPNMDSSSPKNMRDSLPFGMEGGFVYLPASQLSYICTS